MSIEAIKAITALLGVLAWPVVVLAVGALLRREIAGLFGRVRQIEGPGSLKVSLDPNKLEQLITEARQENVPAAALAQRIVRSATVLDNLETRILRALFDDDGRGIYHYQQDPYRRALESLLAKGYVTKVGNGFALTPEGLRVTKDYLVGVLQRLEIPEPGSLSSAANR